jgi:hypothetical protein
MFVSLNHPEYGTTHSYKASGFSDAMEYLKSVEWNPAWYHYWMLDIYMTAVTDSQYVSGWLMITNDCKF